VVAERVFLGAAFLGADLFGRDFFPAAFFGAACFFAGFLPFLWTIAHYEDQLKCPEAPFHTGVHAITICPLLEKLTGHSKRLLSDPKRPLTCDCFADGYFPDFRRHAGFRLADSLFQVFYLIGSGGTLRYLSA